MTLQVRIPVDEIFLFFSGITLSLLRFGMELVYKFVVFICFLVNKINSNSQKEKLVSHCELLDSELQFL